MKPLVATLCTSLAIATCFAEEAPVIESVTVDNVTMMNNPKDVVNYTSKKTDPAFLEQLSKKYNGLTDEAKVDALLKEQNYIEVLNYLWTEKDHAKRLAWLEKQVELNHPILMFELANEYQTQNPTIETYINKTMPWLLTGARRTLIDTACTSDKSTEAAAEFLLFTYQEPIMENLSKKYSDDEIQKYVKEHAKDLQKNSIETLKKTLKPIVDGDEQKVPSPTWVFGHGMSAYTGDKNTINEKECRENRKKEALDFLKQADDAEKKL